MDCGSFRDHLPAYLAGEIREPRFGEFVEHEAMCPDCHRFASETVTGPLDGVFVESPDTARTLGSARRLARTQAILDRTQGDDCRFIQLRLAEALDEALDPAAHQSVQAHVPQCAACRSVRDLLQDLPLFYDALPVLRPSRAFTAAVLDRTIGPRPGFWQTVRALWSKPESIWEAAAACALLAALGLTGVVPSYEVVAERMQGLTYAGINGVEARLNRQTLQAEDRLFEPAVGVYNEAAAAWTRLEEWVDDAQAWAARVQQDVETGNAGALYEDVQGVLKPLGLGADRDTDSQPSRAPESESGSTQSEDPDGEPSSKGDDR